MVTLELRSKKLREHPMIWLQSWNLPNKKRSKSDIEICDKCGGRTTHYCGMGACIDRCPRCDERASA